MEIDKIFNDAKDFLPILTIELNSQENLNQRHIQASKQVIILRFHMF